MLSRHIKKIAKKYIAGKASRQEIDILFRWYDKADQEEETRATENDPLSQDLKERMSGKIHAAIDHPPQQSVAIKGNRSRKYLMAAALLGAVVAGTWFWFHEHNGKAGSVNKLCKYSVPKKQRSRIILPDSSVVWLNSDSYIQYNENEKSNTREVVLKGEAFFDVRHNPSKPFAVIANGTVTKVLGTAFNIKAYDDNKNVQVTVTRGKVQVQKQGKTLAVLTPNEQITVQTETGVATLQLVKTDAFTSWAKGAIEFNNDTFEEIASILNRRFNVPIVFASEKLKACRFIAGFDEGVPVEKIITLLCKTNSNTYWSYSEDGKTIIIGEVNIQK
ncbi:FecR domain-containing protein [Danxiaibacter flavus]|uniref:FecR domain-containing protein n=1 Tax=Danxiaibacter flavus TaxID=3049108 RepID=A0ABV3ZEB9_9BACT|nr:FecR domain-containing protein [Chitinophagaceae bacterium DXS]